MNKGIDLAKLSNELEYQAENRRDFIVGTETMAVSLVEGSPKLTFRDMNDKSLEFELTRHALGQIAVHTELLPGQRAVGVLLDFGTDKEKKALCAYINAVLADRPVSKGVRTVGRFWEDPKVIAFVDPRFETVSHFKTLTHMLGTGYSYWGGDITDTYMILVLYPGLVYYHSEVGDSSLMYPAVIEDGKVYVTPFVSARIESGQLPNTEELQRLHDGRDDFLKIYKTGTKTKIPANADVSEALRTVGMITSHDARRKILGHFGKSERTTTGLHEAIVKYAFTSTSTDLAKALDISRIAAHIQGVSDWPTIKKNNAKKKPTNKATKGQASAGEQPEPAS